MVLKDVDNESDSTHPITPMPEIGRHKSTPVDEFTRKYPYWDWPERRRKRLMLGAEGHT